MRKIYKFIAVSIIVILTCCFCVAGQDGPERLDANTIFYEANRCYKNGNYKKAIDLYEKLLKEGLESGPLYYNLGNAYFKTGQKGKAILNYLRAERIMPRDPDLRSNLSYARSLIKGRQIASEDSWLLSRLEKLCGYLTLDEVTVLISIFYLATFIMLILSVLNRKWRQSLRYFIISSLCLFIIFLVVFIVQIHTELQILSVVIVDKTAARFEPSKDATIYYHLYEGQVVRIIKESGPWYQIKRPDGKSGWVPKADIELL